MCRLPRLVVQRLLEGALQISISLGSTQHAWEEASAAVTAPCQELEQALPQQPVLNGDETGHCTNGAKRRRRPVDRVCNFSIYERFTFRVCYSAALGGMLREEESVIEERT